MVEIFYKQYMHLEKDYIFFYLIDHVLLIHVALVVLREVQYENVLIDWLIVNCLIGFYEVEPVCREIDYLKTNDS